MGGGHGLPGKPQLGALATAKWHSHPRRARLAREVRAGCQGAWSHGGQGAGGGPNILTAGLPQPLPPALSSHSAKAGDFVLAVFDCRCGTKEGGQKNNKGEEVNSHAFKELHTQAGVLAAKHSVVRSLIEACVVGQVLINTTELGTVQRH